MTTLLQDIEAFLTDAGMAPTNLGAAALGDRHFVRQLRAGRRVWPETEAKVRAFMAEYAANHDGTDTAGDGTPSHGKTGEISTRAHVRDAPAREAHAGAPA